MIAKTETGVKKGPSRPPPPFFKEGLYAERNGPADREKGMTQEGEGAL